MPGLRSDGGIPVYSLTRGPRVAQGRCPRKRNRGPSDGSAAEPIVVVCHLRIPSDFHRAPACREADPIWVSDPCQAASGLPCLVQDDDSVNVMPATLREGPPVERPRPLSLDDLVTVLFGPTAESERGDMQREIEIRSHHRADDEKKYRSRWIHLEYTSVIALRGGLAVCQPSSREQGLRRSAYPSSSRSHRGNDRCRSRDIAQGARWHDTPSTHWPPASDPCQRRQTLPIRTTAIQDTAPHGSTQPAGRDYRLNRVSGTVSRAMPSEAAGRSLPASARHAPAPTHNDTRTGDPP